MSDQPIYEWRDFRISGILANHSVNHFFNAFPSHKLNLMASAATGDLVFLASELDIRIYALPDFSAKIGPDPNSLFPPAPLKVIRPAPAQIARLKSRAAAAAETVVAFNHIKVGMVGQVECLIAVGDLGLICVWEIGQIRGELFGSEALRAVSDARPAPLILEAHDTCSTWGIATSPGNELMATSSNAHAITIFHYPRREVIFSQLDHHLPHLKGDSDDSESFDNAPILHQHNVPSLNMSDCGRWMVSCGIDGRLFYWRFNEDGLRVFNDSNGVPGREARELHKEWGWLAFFTNPEAYDDNVVLRQRGEKSHSNEGEAYTKTHYQTCWLEVEEEATPESFAMLQEPLDSISESDSYVSEESEETSLSFHPSEPQIDAANMDASSYFIFNPVIDPEATLFEGLATEDEHATWPSEDVPWEDEEAIDSGGDFSDEDEVDFTLMYLNGFHIKFFHSSPINPAIPYNVFHFLEQSGKLLRPGSFPKVLWQSADLSSEVFGFPMQRSSIERLGLGEWIPEWGVAVVFDSRGHFILLQPTAHRRDSADAVFGVNKMAFPYVLGLWKPCVGYTLIRRFSCEGELKIHLLSLHQDATFRLYELTKLGKN